jgi:hypothetical protein
MSRGSAEHALQNEHSGTQVVPSKPFEFWVSQQPKQQLEFLIIIHEH